MRFMSIQNLTNINNIFAKKLLTWQKTHGRHNLPWQVSDPYRIWLSEIMLQQTQVSTVLSYYDTFLHHFPTVQDLANASLERVFALWAGLGYYSRAKNLHNAAIRIATVFNGQFPQSRAELETLSGVGRTTAAAISAFAFNQRETILDGNVKRVLCRVLALDGKPEDKAFQDALWQHAEQLLPESEKNMPAYTQGLMDLGSTVCKRSKPLCTQCPMQDICLAKRDNLVDVLPRKKTPTKVQTITLYWLIILFQDGKILIEKRPNTGIWGQLFCCPSLESHAQANQWLSNHHLNLDDFTEEAMFEHKLTHRQLLITPMRLTGLDNSHPLHQRAQDIQHIQTLGIPKPFSQYLLNFVHAPA